MNILSRNAATTVIVFCSQIIFIKLATSFTPPHILSTARKFSTSDKVGKLASFQLTSNHNNLEQSIISNVREKYNFETLTNTGKACASLALFVSVFFSSPTLSIYPSSATAATNEGASAAANAKITTGGASTLQSGRTIAITRGVNLDRSDFSSQNLRGVAFQQSIVRDANFAGSNLVGSSFFDATVDGSNFEGAGEYYVIMFHQLFQTKFANQYQHPDTCFCYKKIIFYEKLD